MNNRKKQLFTLFFILSITLLPPQNSLAFQVKGNIPTANQYNKESFVTGSLIKLTKTEIHTTVGIYPIDRSVDISDSRTDNPTDKKNYDVQLIFQNDILIKLSIY